jgi:hypothetical protein
MSSYKTNHKTIDNITVGEIFCDTSSDGNLKLFKFVKVSPFTSRPFKFQLLNNKLEGVSSYYYFDNNLKFTSVYGSESYLNLQRYHPIKDKLVLL